MRLKLLLIALPLVFSLAAPLAFAGHPNDTAVAKRAFKLGQRQYKLGRFDKALESFSRAYESRPLPAFLFNIAQCHRQLGNLERAVFFFEGFLREAPTAKNRDLAAGLLEDTRKRYAAQLEEADRQKQLSEELEQERQEKGRIDAERKAQEEEAERQRVAASERQEQLERTQDMLREQFEREQARAAMQPPPPPIYKKPWFWGTMGGAVAVVAGGTALAFILANNSTQTVDPAGSVGTLDRR